MWVYFSVTRLMQLKIESPGPALTQEAKVMDESQRQKLAELFAQEHVAVIITQGEEWPTATLQAFAEKSPDMSCRP